MEHINKLNKMYKSNTIYTQLAEATM